jgi:hypothetical protein
VTTIGDYAFCGIIGPIEISIPDSVTTIGEGAFSGTGLSNITLPDGITKISNRMFGGSKIDSIIIPGSVTEIGDSAFGRAELTGITIPEGVKTIGESAFSGTTLTSIVLPDSVTYIGWSAFSNGFPATPGVLKEITLGSSLETIRPWAFSYTGIANIVIPDSVTTIEALALNHMPDLTRVVIPDSFQIPPIRRHEWGTGPASGYSGAYTLVEDGRTELFFLHLLQAPNKRVTPNAICDNINRGIIFSFRGNNYNFDDLIKYYDYDNYVYTLYDD